MLNSNLHKKIVTQYLFAAFASVLMLLSSCTVKQNLGELFGVQYEKPLNPNKSLVPGSFSSCSFTDVKSSIAETTVSKKLVPALPPTAHATADLEELHQLTGAHRQHTRSAVKVPFYILYKKMKYDMA